ncbi:aldolase [Escherichia coli]|uniref:Aldolase n=1 Tax=Escherichia coli TaxID=562 RepID=A0A2X1Q8Z4_ECOLX|nr:aldolase [Escherichia coli]
MTPFFHEPKESFYHERFRKVEQSLREEMTRIASSFFQRGYATGSAGNLSLLLPDGNLLATPTGSCLGNLDPQRLSKVARMANG